MRVVVQFEVADEPCGSAQQPDGPPGDTTGERSGEADQHEVEHRHRKAAGDIVQPANHGDENDLRSGGCSRKVNRFLHRLYREGGDAAPTDETSRPARGDASM